VPWKPRRSREKAAHASHVAASCCRPAGCRSRERPSPAVSKRRTDRATRNETRPRPGPGCFYPLRLGRRSSASRRFPPSESPVLLAANSSPFDCPTCRTSGKQCSPAPRHSTVRGGQPGGFFFFFLGPSHASPRDPRPCNMRRQVPSNQGPRGTWVERCSPAPRDRNCGVRRRSSQAIQRRWRLSVAATQRLWAICRPEGSAPRGYEQK